MIETLADLRAVAPAWDALLARAGGSVFLTPEWITSWFEALGDAVAPAVVVSHGDQGELRGVLPMARATVPWGPAHLRLTGFAGAQITTSDHLGLICETEQWDRVWPVMRDWIVAESRRADVVRFAGMDDGPTAAALATLGANGGLAARGPLRGVAPALDLPASYEEYEKRLSGQRRQHLRRYWRRLERDAGPIRVAVNAEVRSLDAVLADMTRLHVALWQSRGLPGTLGDPAMQRFLARFCAAALQRGWLRLYQLYSGDRMMAAALVLHWGDTASYYQSGWDVSAAELQVGELLLAHTVRCAIEQGMRRYDFLRGAERYKERFATHPVPQLTYEFAARPTGRLFLAAASARAAVGSALRRLGVRRSSSS